MEPAELPRVLATRPELSLQFLRKQVPAARVQHGAAFPRRRFGPVDLRALRRLAAIRNGLGWWDPPAWPGVGSSTVSECTLNRYSTHIIIYHEYTPLSRPLSL